MVRGSLRWLCRREEACLVTKKEEQSSSECRT
jgi:hypothetical protein